MKKILGLDLGSSSIGWAFITQKDEQQGNILGAGVRILPVSNDEIKYFNTGKGLTLNAQRTIKRSARRRLDRYRQRRKKLIRVLEQHNIINADTVFTEQGKKSKFQTFYLRNKSASEKITLEEFARVLLMLNKKRGYKSSRKSNKDEGGSTDGESGGAVTENIDITSSLRQQQITPGQFVLNHLQENKTFNGQFSSSDLQKEFDTIWQVQKKFYPRILTEKIQKEFIGKKYKETWKNCKELFGIEGIKLEGKKDRQAKTKYELRAKAISEKLNLEHLAIVLQEINGQISKAGKYLSLISARSNMLSIDEITIGQYLYQQLKKDPHFRVKDLIFYRQNYIDEFEKIWNTQAQHYKDVLTPDLKKEIKENIIFFQRRLKSQKHLVANCEFEQYSQCIPKSSPLFQEFKVWQNINNIIITNIETKEQSTPTIKEKNQLFERLSFKKDISEGELMRLFDLKKNVHKINFNKSIQGNTTLSEFLTTFINIADIEGHDKEEISKLDIIKQKEALKQIFDTLDIDTSLLDFNSSLNGKELTEQKSYQFWHLLYADEDNEGSLNKTLISKFGFDKKHTDILKQISYNTSYGSLSTKAIKKILPFLKEGLRYDEALYRIGKRHSHYLTKQENEHRTLLDKLPLVKRNSLRNPLVEKILNQLIHLINDILNHPELGRPDEIHIEMTRGLKSNAEQRKKMTKDALDADKRHKEIEKTIKNKFKGITKVSRNDIMRHKLYEELKSNGYKLFYSDKKVIYKELFSKNYEIEHIVPKTIIYDDSFANKTLVLSDQNVKKGKKTAYDFLKEELAQNTDYNFEAYKARMQDLFKNKHISQAKYNRLTTTEKDLNKIYDGFIKRQLQETGYISKKAHSMLKQVTRKVISTNGKITDMLRSEWGIVDVMKELNFKKFKQMGLTKTFVTGSGNKVEQIIDWTKRNDHRHHAMDAIVIAFTKHEHIKYQNTLNALGKQNKNVHALKNILTETDETDKKGRNRFKAPIPFFKEKVKKQLENILISYRTGKKVTTLNKNKTKDGHIQITQTPRGALHQETIYGKVLRPFGKKIKINSNFTKEKALKVTNSDFRTALLKRLESHKNDPKKAFAGANSLSKKPILVAHKAIPENILIEDHEILYTTRKPIDKDLKIEKVIDKKIREILQNRLNKYDHDVSKAFGGLENNPIWLNKNKGISIKRVTIGENLNTVPIRVKQDVTGKDILNTQGKPVEHDYVQLRNNHHVAVYVDKKGKFYHTIVTFLDAVHRKLQDRSVIDYAFNSDPGKKFVFSLKINDYFIIDDKDNGFKAKNIKLLDPNHTALISKHLFRVQKISKNNQRGFQYVFRHHLESTLDSKLKTAMFRLSSAKDLNRLTKVHVNRLGKIYKVGE